MRHTIIQLQRLQRLPHSRTVVPLVEKLLELVADAVCTKDAEQSVEFLEALKDTAAGKTLARPEANGVGVVVAADGNKGNNDDEGKNDEGKNDEGKNDEGKNDEGKNDEDDDKDEKPAKPKPAKPAKKPAP